MIRPGFVYPHYGDSWLGGLNYLRNLMGALAAHPELGVRPLLLAPRGARVDEGLVGAELVRPRAMALHEWLEVRSVWRRLEAAPLLERMLRAHGADCLSHGWFLGRRARLPVLAWIPDLQHRRLPGLFPPAELAVRDRLFRATLQQAALVLVSSEAARDDVDHAYPGHGDKLRLLRFVDSAAGAAAPGADQGSVATRHGLAGPYLLLPNQYWIHKNHRVVLEALGLLAQQGRVVRVVSTGSTGDYRSPGHFETLLRRRQELGLEDRYRILGVVPYADLAALMRGAQAVINPSLFEGWSTTVEEAKSLGKRVLLSDIPVHREQAPERARYFHPERPEELAEAMWEAWTAPDDAEEVRAADRAAAALPARRRAFAETYAAVLREVVPGRG